MPTDFDTKILDQLTNTTKAALNAYYKHQYKIYSTSYDNGTITVRLSSQLHPDTFVITLTEYTH